MKKYIRVEYGLSSNIVGSTDIPFKKRKQYKNSQQGSIH